MQVSILRSRATSECRCNGKVGRLALHREGLAFPPLGSDSQFWPAASILLSSTYSSATPPPIRESIMAFPRRGESRSPTPLFSAYLSRSIGSSPPEEQLLLLSSSPQHSAFLRVVNRDHQRHLPPPPPPAVAISSTSPFGIRVFLGMP